MAYKAKQTEKRDNRLKKDERKKAAAKLRRAMDKIYCGESGE